MANDMMRGLMNAAHNSIKIKQSQTSKDGVTQTQSVYIRGGSNNVNITQTISGNGNNVIGMINTDDFDHGRKTVDEMREDILKFNHVDRYDGWSMDDELAVENMRKEDQENKDRALYRDLMKKWYHGIQNTDKYDKDNVGLNDYLHFEDTDEYKEGYVLIQEVQGTNIRETYRYLPAFISKKLSRIIGDNTRKERYPYPYMGEDHLDRACNIYYRVKDNLLYALMPSNRYGCIYLEDCQLIPLKYFRDNDVSAYVYYDPKNDYLYTKDDNTIVFQHVTMTTKQKILHFILTYKLSIALLIIIIIVTILNW